MVKFAAFALVALVAFQACSARHTLKASSPVVDSTYDAAFDAIDNAAGNLIRAVYDASVEFTTFVRDVETALVFEDMDPEMYGDPEVVVDNSLASIDAKIQSTAEAYSSIIEAATAKITDIVAQASAGVQDTSATALLSLIQQKYTEALEGVLDIANDFSDNAADVARSDIDKRPNMNSVRTMQNLRQMYNTVVKSVDRKINKASEQIDAAIAKA